MSRLRMLIMGMLSIAMIEPALAEEGQTKRLSDLNQEERLVDGGLWQQVERIGQKKEIRCMKAFPHKRFCGCLSEELPFVYGIAEYAAIVSMSPTELDTLASGLPEDEKKAVDVTLAAREACVARLLNSK